MRKARDKVFHLKCFTCFVCRKQLLTGEELYVVDDTKFVCKEDYNHRLNGEMILQFFNCECLCSKLKNLKNLKLLHKRDCFRCLMLVIISDSMYEDEDELEEDGGLDGEDSLLDHPKLGTEANNNSLLGLSPRLSPASALDKTPPMADSSTERDMLNDSDGSVAIFSMTMTRTT